MKYIFNATLLQILAVVASLSLSDAFTPIINSNHHRIGTGTRTTSSLNANANINADLITFDLDDTIFPVGPVVADANKELIQHLHDNGYNEITQETLIASTKFIRNELMQNENKAITYTELRKRAICFEMNKHHEKQNCNDDNGNTFTYTDSIVVKAYDLWEHNRHLAAEKHLYHDTIQMLNAIKKLYPNVIIGAITNGKGNPLHMKSTVHTYFDFCISGEDENVFPFRKPHEMIYLKTLEYVQNEYTNTNNNDEEKVEGQDLCWIHVGDDLANDVGASAQCGALAIWADLNEEEYSQSANSKSKSNSNDSDGKKKQEAQPFYSTATKEEIERREKLNQESMKYVSGRIERLFDLPQTIKEVIAESESAKLQENVEA
jgi:FMN phosphatase YigB (HAD superfamily)